MLCDGMEQQAAGRVPATNSGDEGSVLALKCLEHGAETAFGLFGTLTRITGACTPLNRAGAHARTSARRLYGIPGSMGYHAAWDTRPHGIPCGICVAAHQKVAAAYNMQRATCKLQ